MDTEVKKNFRERLRLIINNKFGSQKNFAERFDIKPNTLSNYITGRTEPDISTILFLSECLNESIDWILTGNVEHTTISSHFDLDLWDEVHDACQDFAKKNNFTPKGRFYMIMYQSLIEERERKPNLTIEDILKKHKPLILSQKN